MILAAFDGMQERLTQEKQAPYRAHFKQDTSPNKCQTVSHLSSVLAEPSMGAFFAGVSKTLYKIRLSGDS
jgi:hypothetical protein